MKAEINGQYAAARSAFRRAVRPDPNFGPARERATFVRPIAASAGETPTAVNGVNRPLVGIPSTSQPHLATGPAYPVVLSTVIITIVRP